MSDFKIKESVDTEQGKNAIIPIGSIIASAASYTIGSEISNSRCPCDGRALNTYTYRELHSIISNIYGGTAYSVGVTDQVGVTTTFNVPNIMQSVGQTASGSNQVFIAGSVDPSALSPTITNPNSVHSHNTVSSNTLNAQANMSLSSHAHNIPARTSNADFTAHNHDFTFTAQTLNNPSGSIARTDGGAISAGIGHSHTSNTYGNPSFNTTGAAHNHAYASTHFSNSAEQPSHTHNVSSMPFANIVDSNFLINYVSLFYYIKI
jgi:hypothetical protein